MATVVMVTTAGRVHYLNNFLRSLAEFAPEHEVFIHVQGDVDYWEKHLQMPQELHWGVMRSPQALGCHAARIMALRAVSGSLEYVNVDDDVELIEQTNWAPAIAKAQEPGVGFVLTNWVRHPNLLEKRIAAMEDVFKPQVMVYQGGGMAYGEDVAELMRELKAEPARYDDIWPLTAYLNGYRNYRYMGSLAVHRIMAKGGMNSYMRSEPRPLLCWDWINYRKLNGQPVGSDYSIPGDGDLKPIAKDTHKEARAAKGWS